jgi:hypothetical protein
MLGIEIFRIRHERLGIVLTFLCSLLFPAGNLLAETLVPEPEVLFYERFMKGLETGVTDPFGFHYYYREGFRSESPDGHLKMKIGGEMRLDGGNANIFQVRFQFVL